MVMGGGGRGTRRTCFLGDLMIVLLVAVMTLVGARMDIIPFPAGGQCPPDGLGA
jgi:hypothetical protein